MCTWTTGRTLTSEKVAEMYLFGIANKRFVRNLRMTKTWENHKSIVRKNTDAYYMFKRAMQRTADYKTQKWMREHSNEWKELHNGKAQVI